MGEKNTQWEVGTLVALRQNACYYRNKKWTFEDLLPCYCYAMRTKRTTIR